MSMRMKRWIRILLLPLLVIVLSVWGANYILTHKPEPSRASAGVKDAQRIDARSLQAQAYQVELSSYGVVQPRTESQLVAQVGGQVVTISEHLREGAFFEAGDLLLEIDDRDYRAAVEVAEAQLIQAQSAFKEEQARAGQAARDWARLGKGEASALALREPQLAAAQAGIASAKAQQRSAVLNLERTLITAPYAGRVLEKLVDKGRVVSSGTELASIYAVDYVEVRLPLNNRQLEFVDLPEQYRGGEFSSSGLPAVTLSAQIGRSRYHWQGRVVRVEGAIDSRSRQLFVVAQVDDPYSLGPQGNPPLKIGQFVEARIQGRLLEEVFVLPRTAINQDQRVLLVEEGVLVAREVEPLWRDEQSVIVAAGLSAGELLNLTPLGALANGARVQANIERESQQAATHAADGKIGSAPATESSTKPASPAEES
ncbi:MAG: RND family efflux transporter MFP subunit [Motiliproteus sp.]|jgi:RND family efflux transporter MFP subunit